MTDGDYHEHPALSYSTGKLLLRSQQHYLHARANRETSDEFDFGHAVHALVLGVGEEIVEIPHTTYRTKEAREMRDQAHAEGKVPLKAAEFAVVKACAEAVLAHPTARAWLDAEGETEVPLFATDPETGVEIRGKLDRLVKLGKRHVPVDLKTVTDAREGPTFRAVRDYDYDMQAAMYRRLVRLARHVEPSPMVLICVEKAAPHGVAVWQLAHEDIVAAGELKLATALARAKELHDGIQWLGYPLGNRVLTPPAYYLTDLEERFDA